MAVMSETVGETKDLHALKGAFAAMARHYGQLDPRTVEAGRQLAAMMVAQEITARITVAPGGVCLLPDVHRVTRG
jgi:hypothetical protein